jgi:hypothetical protein
MPCEWIKIRLTEGDREGGKGWQKISQARLGFDSIRFDRKKWLAVLRRSNQKRNGGGKVKAVHRAESGCYPWCDELGIVWNISGKTVTRRPDRHTSP